MLDSVPSDRPIVLADADEGRLVDALAAVSRPDTTLLAVRCDVTDPIDLAQLAAVVEGLGGLRSLVHAAGVSPHMADGRRILEVNLVGTVRLLGAMLPLAGAGTAAVCVGSIGGYWTPDPRLDELLDDPVADDFIDRLEADMVGPLDGPTGYGLASRGVMRACERLARVWGKRGARIVCVAPGVLESEMGHIEMQDRDLALALDEGTPLVGDVGGDQRARCEHVADLIAFLCSDSARFISGCDIRIDGGLVGAERHRANGTSSRWLMGENLMIPD
jgi:NAD(P)-dependent dehydrogenase (short-subunit alcohol dehydrogenase family)